MLDLGVEIALKFEEFEFVKNELWTQNKGIKVREKNRNTTDTLKKLRVLLNSHKRHGSRSAIRKKC
jgi:hypothetical protein